MHNNIAKLINIFYQHSIYITTTTIYNIYTEYHLLCCMHIILLVEISLNVICFAWPITYQLHSDDCFNESAHHPFIYLQKVNLLYLQNICVNLCNITDWLEACDRTPYTSSVILLTFGELHEPYSNLAIRHDAINIMISDTQNSINVIDRTVLQ